MSELPTTALDLTDDATPFEIADRLALLKLQEEAIRNRRIAVEARLIQALDFPRSLNRPNAKSRTWKLDDKLSDAVISVTLKKNEKLKLEPADLDAVRDRIPPELLPVRVKEEVDAKAYTALQADNPELAALFSRAVVRVPQKTGVEFPKPKS